MQIIRLDRFQYTELQNNFSPKKIYVQILYFGGKWLIFTDFWKQFITSKLDN
jgi:hypothetical protein